MHTNHGFPRIACNGKIAGGHYYAHAAIVASDFNATRDCASPADAVAGKSILAIVFA